MSRLLIVENDKSTADHLEQNFQREGYDVAIYYNGNTALEALTTFSPDCVILDLLAPTANSLDICRSIRQQSITPIIVIAFSDDEINKILAFELGADNYLTKPFSFDELKAFVKALIRRTKIMGVEPILRVSEFEYADLKVNLVTKTAYLAGEVIDLTPKEYELLAFLGQHYGEIYPREELLAKVWGNLEHDTRIVDHKIYTLRNKLLDDHNQPRFVHTAYAVGYYFRYDPTGIKKSTET
jgi:two-component system, OmpR family, response regulator VicR